MAIDHQYHLLLFFFLALLPFSTVAQTYGNISLGTSFTAQADNSSWAASPSGDFAFGFQQIEENGFLLSIWFNKIPERTIVWSANGQNLAPKGSKIELTSDGWFLLSDPSGNKIWPAGSSGGGTVYAAMLDTGNFVLAGKNSQYLWQSFNQPTDTILPGQVLNQPGTLVARYLETNHSSGRFQFVLNTDGTLALYTTNFPILNSLNYPYWNTKVVGRGFSLVFNNTGYIFLGANNGSIIQMISSNAPSTQDFYQRAILEHDGVFRHYVYPKSSSSNQKAWSSVSFIPSNICMSITEPVGNGACGFNSYCTLDGGKSCQCPSGYSFIDPGDVMKGCMQDFDSQSCNESFPETDLFDFYEMENTDWPYSDFEHFQSVTVDWCRQACLVDCFCAVAIFRNGECWKKKLPLSNGRIDSTVGGIALIKTRKDNSTTKFEGPIKRNNQSKLIIVGSVLLSSSVVVNLFLLVTAFLVAYRFGHRNSQVNQSSQLITGMFLRSFTYEELRKATNGFKEELGRGAFSTVYKGVLLDLMENPIAVKKLNNMVKENEDEFKTEVSAIGRTNHRNLVQLVGFCNEGEHRLLVYEFMSKGSLASFLFDSQRPTWFQRMQIALGTARGLLYLHEECTTQIIHCDIKPQNVLLDDSCTSKISDFGLAKLLKIDQIGTNTAIRGTKGYVAPEWFRNMPITIKVDVYSYGVLLLEIICCRKSFESKVENENQMVLIDWAYDCFQERKLDLLVVDDKDALDDMKRVEKYVMVALWCVQEDPSLRPTMKKVLQMLEGSTDVPIPPDLPSFTISM
ncbi:G-type lectin S-receptor-like serine/threonine-protein kinase LECRK3 [Gastrolobium bilobum]|uniref:G-type lectin S-receptor-like serine/threonine-protein kinase LECRK3 n=1 Tax=Gastrolobium bilobum TaxID=150636 RepID=UPI002AB0C0F7|nr:G-type lectin S-receptor-like serine/threonine-protein kinase LECRK3 [Gastrolobium bilobum]